MLLTLLLLSLLTFSCKKDSPYDFNPNPRNICGFKIAWWGDSFTASPGALPPSWYMTQYLKRDRMVLGDGWRMEKGTAEVANMGYSGWTSTQIKEQFLAHPELWDRFQVFWLGRNNSWDSDQILADLLEMIGKLKHNRFIVIGILCGDTPGEWIGSDYQDHVTAFNQQLSDILGENYLDPLPSLQHYTTSPADQLDKQHNISATSLRLDFLHLNWLGSKFLGEYVGATLVDCETEIAY